ncbi:LysR family transcriptional regulator [Kineococcus sp. NUM-3379]
MDLVAACRAFVAVSTRGSFTVGAAAAGIPQSVASRRVAALEQHLGGRLLDRSARAVTPTSFGRDLLPSAKRLVDLADALVQQADTARQRPTGLAVPAACPQDALVRLVAEARAAGLHLELHPAGPGERAELVRTREVRAALVAVPADEGTWRVPLGLALGAPARGPVVYLDTLRPGRVDRGEPPRRIWVQAEDDVPHVRDRLRDACNAVGLHPGQVVAAVSVVPAAAEVLVSGDLLLCSREEASHLDLPWTRIGEVALERGYRLRAGRREDAASLRSAIAAGIGRCLGAAAPGEGPA